MRRHRRVLSLAVAALVTIALTVGVTPASSAASNWWEPSNRPSPDSGIGATGAPFTGTVNGEVRGFVDGHNHILANEGFGGRLICGKAFSPAGVADALKDCPEHYPDGAGATFENLTADPDGHHDPVGWPTFKEWPTHQSLTHQQNYYAWIERAWRGGLRVMVNDLVTNGVLCALPIMPKDRGCDEMDAIRLEAAKSWEMQAYIDGVYGGPGKGFFRIVTSPEQARQVVKDGKLAIILGVETSEPFGCKMIMDVAQCTEGQIDAGINELYSLGVRSMFLCHKFDNGLCGVRFDSGTIGQVLQAGQFSCCATTWNTEVCPGPQMDNPIIPQDPAKRCNTRGLTRLGEHALRRMMERHMMVEIDHMSVKAAARTLDILEAEKYPGVLSTHSWMDTGWSERVYKLGGFITGYDNASESFVAEWRRNKALRDRYNVGYGFGSDMNGVGGWPGPRTGAPNPVVYPYRSFDGATTMDRLRTGDRVWDVNVDGAAHYGLIPDWIEDVRMVGGQAVIDDMARGAESYLRTWAATAAHGLGTNLAAGKPATASSVEWNPFVNFSPGQAVDGNRGTRWSSSWNDGQWWYVDLGSEQTVGRVTIDWEPAYASEYRLEQWSEASQTWRTVWSTTAGRGGIETARFEPVTTRWVRFYGVKRATRYCFSFWELGVYAS
ncbi:discoidin domain-containing protein [Longispora sp. NPDC051575]|uniref:galactose-binding domain-containing protein n=1 Tax=Longispora sp. NPDC051575 TaxID=3154943 RepID=UPI0034469313